jgi:hypothetical protein
VEQRAENRVRVEIGEQGGERRAQSGEQSASGDWRAREVRGVERAKNRAQAGR